MNNLEVYSDSFEFPQDNMRFDEGLLTKVREDGCPRLRLYRWGRGGVTYPYTQALPLGFENVLSSSRLTGGGMVFHANGDVVWSYCGLILDPKLPDHFKDKLAYFSSWIEKSLMKQNVVSDSMGSSELVPSSDLRFCAMYPSPFEIAVGGQKVSGLAVRRFRFEFLIQGVIHLSSNFEQFSEEIRQAVPSLAWTQGVGPALDAQRLIFDLGEGFYA